MELEIYIHNEILSQFSTTDQFLLDFILCEEKLLANLGLSRGVKTSLLRDGVTSSLLPAEYIPKITQKG